MVREFAIVILDSRDKLQDRFNLELVSNPKGLGFLLAINIIETDIEEIPVSLKQKLQPVTLDVNYAYGKKYESAKALRLWIEKNINKRMALEWTTPADRLYADCKVVEFEFSELSPLNFLSIPLTIRPLSPFFDVVSGAITVSPSTTGKEYPFMYPYTYGVGLAVNNRIENNYIKPIPLIITLYGEMTVPTVTITQEGEASPYARVYFGLTLTKGQYITINAVTRKIIFFNGLHEEDGYNFLDFTNQSFIFAREGTTSFLNAPGVQSDKSGFLEASYRRYKL